MKISAEIQRAIDDIGFDKPTEIQAKSIPVIKQNIDVIGKSQTGTGKTVAFGIPAIEKVDAELKAVQILILCPTRELAMQACDEMRKLTKFKEGIKIVDVYGGAPMDRQIARLKSANIVIGTPGRVMDHMKRKTLKLDNLKMAVLDEADEMLSMGFRDDIEKILESSPEDRQTILFSATMPKEILDLTKKFQKDPVLIEVKVKQMTVENISQHYYNVPMGKKMDALNLILSYANPKRAILFCNTKRMVDELTQYLHKYNFSADGLHGDMKQSQRTTVMNSFKAGRTNILIATDVAARGIDVNDIDYVINYDIPQNIEYYVHRIGRTGRAGKSGTAISICSGRNQVDMLKKIARITNSKISEKEIPSVENIIERHNDLVIAQVENLVKSTTDFVHMDTVEELAKRGYDPKSVAAVLLQLQFGKKECELADIKSVKPTKANRNDIEYSKIIMSVGRNKKIAPAHIVSAIANLTSIVGSEIGKIEIYDKDSIVAIPSEKLDEVLINMRDFKINGSPATVVEKKAKRAKPKKDHRRGKVKIGSGRHKRKRH